MFPRPPPSSCLCFIRRHSVSPLRLCWAGEQRTGWRAPGFERRAEEESKLPRHGGSQHGHERPRRAPQHRDTHTTHDANPTNPTCSARPRKGQNAKKSHNGPIGHSHTTDPARSGNGHTAYNNTETHQAKLQAAGFIQQRATQ